VAPLNIVDQKLKNWEKSQNAKGTDIPKELPLTPAIGAWIIDNSVPKKLFVAMSFRHVSFFS
tara:strand:- start:356 stop:541 length:186 start_codon:yes stop_codon:yes gene_type:complete